MPARRWCSECLLLGESLDRGAVRAALDALGADSVVLAGGAARLRVHAHVGAPQALFDACAGFGAVEGMKADDMLLQSRSAGSRQAVAIVTDSAADLPEAVIQAHPLHVVPLRVNLDGRDYLDKVGLGTSAFYRRMAAARDLPRTSQPPPGDFRRVFEFLRAHHADVVYVGLSRAVSGTLQSAEQAASRIEGGGVRAFDTVNAAGGQALLAWRAAELAASGADAGTILRELQRLRPLTLTWAMARDIRHAVRGGRIPAWAAPAVRFSGLTPVARMRGDGTLGIAGGLRGLRGETCPAHGTEWRAALARDRRPLRCRGGRATYARRPASSSRPGRIAPGRNGPAIGAHAGRGALVVALQPAPTDEAGSAAEASV
ncbi:MAG: DegV family protein [Luteimonas sp.]